MIGLTGSFGSGCSYIAKHILAKRPKHRIISLSDILKEEFKKKKQNLRSVDRRALQDFGDEMRKKHEASWLANKAIDKIEADGKLDDCWIIDSIRNPGEVHALREYSTKFFLFAICADKEIRWGRPEVQARYNKDKRTFDKDDLNDSGDEKNLEYGQRVSDCVSEADFIIKNNENIKAINNEDFKGLESRVIQYAELAEVPLRKRQPVRQETLMAMAYAISQRSSCSKRKVGAIIVDEIGNVISSGYNEVPMNERPCKDEWSKCYRDHLCEEFFNDLLNNVPEIACKGAQLRLAFRKKFKILDYCRALHAEENAIINLAKNGRSVPLNECTLYTTTYPCRLCANKIAGVGIRKIVYLEPYPQEDARDILASAGVTDELFEGVTYKAYFRIYGDEK
ncbi:MAG: deaminase [Candidatus Sumerlaeota bacterium]|nr:deaminase [Candidatus Sumerlaeota bacterium]